MRSCSRQGFVSAVVVVMEARGFRARNAISLLTVISSNPAPVLTSYDTKPNSQNLRGDFIPWFVGDDLRFVSSMNCTCDTPTIYSTNFNTFPSRNCFVCGLSVSGSETCTCKILYGENGHKTDCPEVLSLKAPTPGWRDSAVEDCVRIMGEPAFKGSYAAPREAFDKILAEVERQAEIREASKCAEHEKLATTAFKEKCVQVLEGLSYSKYPRSSDEAFAHGEALNEAIAAIKAITP